MKVTPAAPCPASAAPSLLLKGRQNHSPTTPLPLHSNTPFSLQKVFLGLGLPQAEELPTLLEYI